MPELTCLQAFPQQDPRKKCLSLVITFFPRMWSSYVKCPFMTALLWALTIMMSSGDRVFQSTFLSQSFSASRNSSLISLDLPVMVAICCISRTGSSPVPLPLPGDSVFMYLLKCLMQKHFLRLVLAFKAAKVCRCIRRESAKCLKLICRTGNDTQQWRDVSQ